MDLVRRQRTEFWRGSVFLTGLSPAPLAWLGSRCLSGRGTGHGQRYLGFWNRLQETALQSSQLCDLQVWKGLGWAWGEATRRQKQMAESSVHLAQGVPLLFDLERKWLLFSQSHKPGSLFGPPSFHQPSPRTERRIQGEKGNPFPSSL